MTDNSYRKRLIARFQKPVLRRSLWQLANTLVPYFLLWVIMILALDISYWITLGLAVIAAGFLSRIFIIFHDCTHDSFTASRPINRLLEFITGTLTFTPYRLWRHVHSLHHATSGDLDARGNGDIWTLTVQEYLDASPWKRLAYRVVRNPLILFLVAPLYLFLIHYRVPPSSASAHFRRGVHLTNGAILGILVMMSLTIGIKTYLLVQLPIMLFAGSMGVWLFYVQHQFEGVYWERRRDWNFVTAAVRGSSFYKLPRALQWFTGNIGFHHVHHLSPAIPNYSLERCHHENPILHQVRTVTLLSSLRSLSFRLWDEQSKRLVGFDHLRSIRNGESSAS